MVLSGNNLRKVKRLYSLKDRKHEDSEGKDVSDGEESNLASLRRIRASAGWFMIYLVEAQGTFPSWSG